METELEQRETRLVAARKTLAELSRGSVAVDFLAEVDQAHAAVDAAERHLAGARMPALAVRARQRLRSAQEAEQRILAAHGYESWLGLQLRRIDTLFAQPSPEARAAAETEYLQALMAWEELSGVTEMPAAAAVSYLALRHAARLPEHARPAVA